MFKTRGYPNLTDWTSPRSTADAYAQCVDLLVSTPDRSATSGSSDDSSKANICSGSLRPWLDFCSVTSKSVCLLLGLSLGTRYLREIWISCRPWWNATFSSLSDSIAGTICTGPSPVLWSLELAHHPTWVGRKRLGSELPRSPWQLQISDTVAAVAGKYLRKIRIYKHIPTDNYLYVS